MANQIFLPVKINSWSFGTIVNEKGQLGIGSYVIQLIDGKYRVFSNKAGAHVFIGSDKNYLWRVDYYIKDLGEMRFHKTYVDMFNAYRTNLTTHEYLDDNDELRASTKKKAYQNHINDLMEMMKLKLYQNKETDELAVIREQYEDGSVKIKHLNSPVWETIPQILFEEQYKEIESEEDIE